MRKATLRTRVRSVAWHSARRKFASELKALLASDRVPRVLDVDAFEQYMAYGFVPGVARTSLASRAAARLGVNREELLALIQKNRG